MPTTSVDSLLLLVLLMWQTGAGVFSQSVDVADVRSNYVEVSWERCGQWLGVTEFTVQFSTPESHVCQEVITCKSASCRFKSIDVCGTVGPCTKTSTTISGGDYTAPEIVLITGPERVTNLTLNTDQGALHITWNNPSGDSSSCYEDTAVTLTFNQENTTTHHDTDEEYLDVELCEHRGGGTVRVWATGGDGKSSEVSISFYLDESDLVHLVEMGSCKPMGCFSLQTSWNYLPACSTVASFNVSVDHNAYQAADIDTTNMTFTGLEPKMFYTLCVTAVNAKGAYIDQSCQDCYSVSAVINNVKATTRPESKSALHVSWNPPLCHVTDIAYHVVYTSFLHSKEYSSSYYYVDFYNMRDYKYIVCVKTQGDPAAPACTTAYTTINSPSDVSTSGINDNVLTGEQPITVSWRYYESDYPNVTITYQVTWGNEHQHSDRTQNKNYTIQKYEIPTYSHSFCVAAIPDQKDDLISDAKCVTEYGKLGHEDNQPSTGLIVGVSVLAIVVIGFIIVVAGYFYKRRHPII